MVTTIAVIAFMVIIVRPKKYSLESWKMKKTSVEDKEKKNSGYVVRSSDGPNSIR